MSVDRRSLLTGGAILALAATAPAEAAPAAANPSKKDLGNVAVYVPGYFPDSAYANGKPLTATGVSTARSRASRSTRC